MSVFRISKTKNYTVMSNHHLRDKNLSLKAKGLLSLMLSLPEEWDYSIGGLCSICKENQTAVKTALKELKTFGYLKVTKLTPNQTESGRIEWVYDIFETPQDLDTENDGTGRAAQQATTEPQELQPKQKQQVENLPIENQPQLNKDKQNKEESNTDESRTDCMYAGRAGLHSEVRKFFEDLKLKGDVDKFIDYYLYMDDDEFRRKFRYLAKKWSNNEFVDLPVRMYDDQYRDAVMTTLPPDLVEIIKNELNESDCMQIRFGTYQRLVSYLDHDEFGLLGL